MWRFAGAVSESGEVVTQDTALTYSAVWCALNLISGTIGSLPLHLMQKLDRGKRIADDRSLYSVMHSRWNPYMTAMTGRRLSMFYILATGNSYAEKVTNGYGEVVELWPIPPKRVLRVDMKDGELQYEIQLEDGNRWFTRDKILHIAGPGGDGFMGYSVIDLARKGIGLGMAMETFGSRFFSSGINPSAVVTHPHKLKDPKAFRTAVSDVYGGLGRTHQLMLLEEAMSFEQIGIKPEESQFLQSRQFQIPEIARWFNLPPHKLKDLTKSSFNNIEEEQISFVSDSILPWLIALEQEYQLQLLTKTQIAKEGLYFKHIVEGLLRANAKERAEFYKVMIGNTVMTPNEVRELEDMNPSDNPLADELFVMVNMVPLSKLEEYLAKKSEPKQITEGNKNETTEEPVQTKSVIKIQNRK